MNCMLIPSVRVAKKSGCLTNQALWHSLTDANSAIPRERSLAWGNKAASAMNPGTRDLNRNYLDGRWEREASTNIGQWMSILISVSFCIDQVENRILYQYRKMSGI